ncbi:uncharacterized protein LOC122064858 [Macadamia integrifolia]|uniref:uncharacterized protein LOC122064858 n=1 Tax=Macadamia integrifolia TaxID=60698 RepID=UPI001C4EFAE2|nr:uncharacterized protein LOC122064858 [Macadamia integrifolia]
MVAQHGPDGHTEQEIYYLSKKFTDYETRYTTLEKTCASLVWATRRLRHYMLTYSVFLVSRMDPIKYLFEKPMLTGILAHWLLLLAKFDIVYVTQKSIKGSVIAEHLSAHPVVDTRPLNDIFPDEGVVSVEVENEVGIWQMFFDGAANHKGCGARVLLITPEGLNMPMAYRLDFECTNNMAEYEAYLMGLKAAISIGVKRLEVYGDSSIFICQVQELHTLSSPWPFSTWGIDVIGKVDPKASNGHEFVLVAIDYFTKWVEAQLYAKLTAAKVAKFLQEHIICRYGMPHEVISDQGQHFRGKAQELCDQFRIARHRSSPYRPQTNGAVEATNKNMNVILQKMADRNNDWADKLPFALWAYRTSIRTPTGATPYSLVYGMEAVLLVELEVPSLRILIESQIPEADWLKSRYEELNLIDEKRMKSLFIIYFDIYGKLN